MISSLSLHNSFGTVCVDEIFICFSLLHFTPIVIVPRKQKCNFLLGLVFLRYDLLREPITQILLVGWCNRCHIHNIILCTMPFANILPFS